MNEQFLNNIPENCTEGVLYITKSFNELIEYSLISNEDYTLYYESVIEYYALLETYLLSKGQKTTKLNFNEHNNKNIESVKVYFNQKEIEFHNKKTNDSLSKSRERFNILFNNTFYYEFTTGDIKRIQELINELRDNISNSELFVAEHQQRILKRLEKLQSELHKKVSNLDQFWGLIGDAGVVIGKFGKDAKPFVDRIREIADIVWKTQARSEELPSNATTPFLKTNVSSNINNE